MKKMTNGINELETTKEKNESKFDAAKKRVETLVNNLKGKKVIILGHDNIDVDSTLSGILMSKLLSFLNIENEFCILEPIQENDTYEIISELIGIDMKKFYEEGECKDRNLFLVDHYETIHEGNVIGCIDHHPNKQEKNYNFMYVRNSCATAYLIYEIMQMVNFPISKEDAKMIVASMLIDTVSFRSNKTIKEEVIEAKKITKDYNLNYEFLEKYGLCLTPIDKLTVEEIITNGQKWYNYNNKKVGSSYLQLYGLPKEKQLNQWLTALRNKLQETHSDMMVFIVFETENNVTYEYQIMNDCIKEIISNGILSRGKNVMPLIEERFLDDMNTEEKMESIVNKLIKERKTIATMESCTGGQLASEITNISGASEVLKESYVSYCNEAKIKFGVSEKVIKKYTVYSSETAIAMAKAVINAAKSDIGVGITGQLGRIDPNNPGCENNNAWYSIIENDKEYICRLYIFEDLTRSEKKKIVIREIVESLYRR